MISPIPEDDPEIKDDPSYKAMAADEQWAFRRSIAIERHRHAEYLAQQAKKKDPTWEDRVEALLKQQIVLLEQIRDLLNS